jgi:predicted nuclease with TOPRIM domain
VNVRERDEITQLRESVQDLVVQVARLNQAVEPLVRLQEEQGDLRDRVSELEGFRAAVLWMAGLLGAGALARYVLSLWLGS